MKKVFVRYSLLAGFTLIAIGWLSFRRFDGFLAPTTLDRFSQNYAIEVSQAVLRSSVQNSKGCM